MTTESDRELLELAANVNGEPWRWGKVPAYATEVPGMLMRDHAHEVDYYPGWNPLENDGDALRLAVKLHIGVRSHGPDHWQQPNVTVALWDFGEQAGRVTVAHGDDPQRATRRAIVRAAAEIARATHKEQT